MRPKALRMLLLAAILAAGAGCSHAPRPAPADAAEARRTVRARPRLMARPANLPAAPGALAVSAVPDSADTAAAVEPQVSSDDAVRLDRDTREKIAEAEARLNAVDTARLDAEQQQRYKMARGFLQEAQNARELKEFARASGLVLKARLLADGMPTR